MPTHLYSANRLAIAVNFVDSVSRKSFDPTLIVIGLPRLFVWSRKRVSHPSTSGAEVIEHLHSDAGALEPFSRGTVLALKPDDMNTNDKKTAALALPEPSPDTEAILLERLKNSTTDEDYFRWMLFVVGFYRGVNKIDAASELLQRFLKISKDIERSAHCYLALGQIATDQQRIDRALVADLRQGHHGGLADFAVRVKDEWLNQFQRGRLGKFGQSARSSSATARNWSFASRLWRSGWETRRFGCWPTTARSLVPF